MAEQLAEKIPRGFLSRMKEKVKFWFFVYSIHSTIYVMEPAEILVIHAFLVAVIGMVLYTSYLFLPGHAVMIIHFLRRMMGTPVDETEAEMLAS